LLTRFLLQVGHEPLPPTVGRNVLGRRVLYLPGFFTYARHIVEVDGKRGLFRGLTPRLISSTLSTITRGSVKKAFPLEDMEHVSNKDDVKTSLRKVVREVRSGHCKLTSGQGDHIGDVPGEQRKLKLQVKLLGEKLWGWTPRNAARGPFYTLPLCLRCSGLVPHVLGDVIFLWCCNLLAHFINTYAVDDNVSGSVWGAHWLSSLSLLCRLRAGLPPYAPVFASWIHCWRYLSAQGQLFRGSSLLFRRAPVPAACFPID
ncbi:MTCH1 protein, partial [Columbina picui]|nr:MTCH1 protein [Columbina picui]